MEQQSMNSRRGFFQKAKLAIFNIEKYPELAAEGVSRAMGYLAKIIAILAIVVGIGMIYRVTQIMDKMATYLDNEFPNFSYQDGILDVQSEEAINIKNDITGAIIIDTKTEDQEKKNQYINELGDNGILVLKEEIIVKNEAMVGTSTYRYDDILKQMGLTNFEKQQVIEYVRGKQMISIYFSVFATLFVYAFMIYFINTIANVLFVSAFGYLANLFTKVRMRYASIFNMSIYAITLSTVLNILYIILNMFVDFNIEYFDVMYLSVAIIYLFAAIFMIKADLQKRQIEVMKIVKVQEEVKKEMEEKEQEEKQKQNKKPEEEKEPKEKKDEKEGEVGGSGPEPEGTGA